MAQTGYTPILTYASGTPGNTPSASNLTSSASGAELAINYADGKLFYKDSGGTVQVLAVKMPSGVLPIANGGTNATATPTAGAVAYGTGTAYAFTSAGTSNQVLISNGSSAPSWSSLSSLGVTSLSFGTTGLTPSTATQGAITVAGTLATTNGGTGLTSFTANGVVYASSTSVLTTGSALTFDGTNLGVGPSSPGAKLDVDAGNPTLVNFGGVTVTGQSSGIRFRTGSTKFAWYVGAQNNVNNVFEITPSTAAGGTTFSTPAIQIDSSGNLGLGVTPSAWATSRTALQMASGSVYQESGTDIGFAQNAYRASGGWTYQNTGYGAGLFRATSGAFNWFTAASGTAGNAITFTQAMTLDASGNLLLGTTSPDAPLAFKGTTGKKISLYSGSDYSIGVESSEFRVATSGITSFYTGGYSGTERARIDSSGNLLVGTTTTASSGIKIGKQYGGVSLDGGGGSYAQWGGSYGMYPRAGIGLGLGSAVAISFEVNGGTEAARIDSSGNLLVGTTSLYGTAGLSVIPNASAGAVNLYWNRTATASTSTAATFSDNSIPVGTITYTNTAVAYNTTSDYRLKENIQPMTGALAKVAQLKPVTYKWKADGSDGEGFIAHELAEVVPQCVTGEKDAVDADGKPVYQGIDTSFLVATLTAAIQEQQAMIQQLQAEVAALKGN